MESDTIRKRTQVILLVLAVLFATRLSLAQIPESETGVSRKPLPQKEVAATPNDPNEQTPIIRIPSNLVETPVTVTDSKGEFVYDLQEKDFHILDNGVPQRIVNFVQEARPLAVVILIQTNEEVSPLLPQLAPVAPLISDLLLGPEGRAAVITYSSRISEAQDFSSSGDVLASTLKGLKTQYDQKRLNDALTRAIALLEGRPSTERRVIIVFSDGFDTGSETSAKDVVQRATAAEVTIYGVGFSRTQALWKQKPHEAGPSVLDQQVTRPTPPNTPPTPTTADNTYGNHGAGLDTLGALAAIIGSALTTPPMDAYAKLTGGDFYSHWSEKALQEQLSRMASEIHSQYDLAYVPQASSQP
ncbi:MAG TPA: VWA domain-containing protein, partial [Terriglobia bacterium]|nr:VWA domain-containing protein [Terriglobia bacterium]